MSIWSFGTNSKFAGHLANFLPFLWFLLDFRWFFFLFQSFSAFPPSKHFSQSPLILAESVGVPSRPPWWPPPRNSGANPNGWHPTLSRSAGDSWFYQNYFWIILEFSGVFRILSIGFPMEFFRGLWSHRSHFGWFSGCSAGLRESGHHLRVFPLFPDHWSPLSPIIWSLFWVCPAGALLVPDHHHLPLLHVRVSEGDQGVRAVSLISRVVAEENMDHFGTISIDPNLRGTFLLHFLNLYNPKLCKESFLRI